jgi:hypothetical protein
VFVSLCAVLALLYAACGEDSPPAPAAPLPEDVLAKSLVLEGSDLPDGWTEATTQATQPATSDKSIDTREGCDIPANPGITGRGVSLPYAKLSGSTLSATVLVMRTSNDIMLTLNTFQRRMDCLVASVNGGHLDDSSAIYSDASFETIDNPEREPALAIHYFQMHAQSKSVPVKEATLYIDTIIVVKDRFVSSLVVSSTDTPPDTDEELLLAEKAWGRLPGPQP